MADRRNEPRDSTVTINESAPTVIDGPSEGIARTISFALVLSILSRVFDLGFYFLIYKYFAIDLVSDLNYIMALSSFFYVFVDAGSSQFLIREFIKNEVGIRRLFFAVSLFRLIVISITCIVVLILNQYIRDAIILLILVGFLIQFILIQRRFFEALFRASSRQTISNLIAFAETPLRLISICFIIWYGAVHSLNALLVVWLLINVILLFPIYIYFKTDLDWSYFTFHRDSRQIFNDLCMFLPSIFTYGYILLLTVIQNRFDWLVIEELAGKSSLASYSLANRAYEFSVLFVGVIVASAYPWLCSYLKGKGDKARLALLLKLTIVISACGPALASIFSWVVPLAFQDKYAEATGLSLWLFPLMLPAAFVMCCYHDRLAQGSDQHIRIIITIATIIQAFVTIICVYYWGAIGAVGGMAAGMFTSFILYWCSLNLTPPIINWNVHKCGCFCLLVTLGSYVCSFLPVLTPQVHTFFIVGAPAVGVLWLVNHEDWEVLRSLVKRIV